MILKIYMLADRCGEALGHILWNSQCRVVKYFL